MTGSLPKYRLIADQLQREISVGVFAVGTLLPTERKLMLAYGVSRPTIRQAIQHLKTRGIVASRQGSGSRIIASEKQPAFLETIQSIDELIAFGNETHREVLSHSLVSVDEQLARSTNWAVGRRILEVKLLRKTSDSAEHNIAYVKLWLDSVLTPVIDALGKEQKSVAEIIRNQFGYETGYVHQTIQADLFGNESSCVLEVSPGDPCLVITRKYAVNADDPPFLVASSRCRAERLQVVSQFHGPH